MNLAVDSVRLYLQMKNKKKVLSVFYVIEGGHGSFNFFKGGHLQIKTLGNPTFESMIVIKKIGIKQVITAT